MSKELDHLIQGITQRERLTSLISVIASLTSLVLAAIYYWGFGVKIMLPIVLAVYSVVNLGVYLYFRSHRNVKIVYLLTAVLIFICTWAISLITGGISSTFIFFIPIVVISGYSMRKKYGDAWLIVSLLSFLVLFMIDDKFIESIHCVAPQSRSGFSLFSLILSTVVLGAIYGRYLATTLRSSIKKTIEISESNLEKETLLTEVRYRVKDNLRIVQELLSLQVNFATDKDTLDYLDFMQNRVHSIDMIHKMLYQADFVSKINYKEYLEDLSDYFQKKYIGRSGEIDIIIESDDIFFKMDTAVPLAMLTYEILTHSFQYSLQDGKGLLSIRLEPLHEANFILEIGDDGQGFSDEIRFNTIGRELMNNLAGKLHGSVEQDRTKNGANYTVIFQEIEKSTRVD